MAFVEGPHTQHRWGTPGAQRQRDPRIDLLRGASLIMIFFDHIPYNRLSNITLRRFGFSDAAEIFVFLAGYSAVIAYAGRLEREGLSAGWRKVLGRCLGIWGVHAGLVTLTLAVALAHETLTGAPPLYVGPLLRDGLAGLLRGLTLQALPPYLDILPLYIILLLLFPVILMALRRSVSGTIAASLGVYAAANLAHLNLPNAIDPAAAAAWSFDPFAWQLLYVLGAAFGWGLRNRVSWLVKPPDAVRFLCGAYLLFALVVADPWALWPAPFGDHFPLSLLGNEPKCFATPWRVLHGLALLVPLLTSRRFAAWARWPFLDGLATCGRQSLSVFAAGCMLALFGRLVFRDFGTGPFIQIAVNLIGCSAMMGLAALIESKKHGAEAAPPVVVAVQEA